MNRLLVDTALEKSLPKLYEQEKSEVKILYARFYHPIYNWEWFAMEYSKLQRLFFGLVDEEVLEFIRRIKCKSKQHKICQNRDKKCCLEVVPWESD